MVINFEGYTLYGFVCKGDRVPIWHTKGESRCQKLRKLGVHAKWKSSSPPITSSLLFYIFFPERQIVSKGRPESVEQDFSACGHRHSKRERNEAAPGQLHREGAVPRPGEAVPLEPAFLPQQGRHPHQHVQRVREETPRGHRPRRHRRLLGAMAERPPRRQVPLSTLRGRRRRPAPRGARDFRGGGERRRAEDQAESCQATIPVRPSDAVSEPLVAALREPRLFPGPRLQNDKVRRAHVFHLRANQRRLSDGGLVFRSRREQGVVEGRT